MNLKDVIIEKNKEDISYDECQKIYSKFMSMPELYGKIYLYEVACNYGYTYDDLIVHLLANNKGRAKSTQNKFNQKLNSVKGYNIPLILNNDDFLKNIKSKYEDGADDFINYLYPLIFLDENEAIATIEKSKIYKEKYYTYLNQFINCYPNKIHLLLYFKRLFDKTNIYIPRSTFSKDELLEDFIKSGLCEEEYCSIHGLSINDLNYVVRYRNLLDQDEESVNLSRIRITKKFEEMCMKIILDEFDIIDYYMETRIPIQCFYNIVSKYEIASSKTAKEKLNCFVKKCRTLLLHKVKKELEFNNMIKINGIEIDRSTKERVFKFIEDNNLPTSLYLNVLKKYIDGKLDLDEKVIKL